MSAAQADVDAAEAKTDRLERTALAAMLALTFATGILDTVGYLGLDRVFTGNMTGNVVILGMGIAGADDLPVIGPALALGAFMFGAAVVGRLLRGRGEGWTTATTVMVAIVGVISALLGVAALLISFAPGTWQALSASSLLATVMGAQAAAARQVGVKEVTTVVVTSTIVGLASESRLGSGTSRRTPGLARKRTLAVVLILLGAAAGGLLLQWHISWALFLAAAVCLTVAVAGHILGRP